MEEMDAADVSQNNPCSFQQLGVCIHLYNISHALVEQNKRPPRTNQASNKPKNEFPQIWWRAHALNQVLQPGMCALLAFGFSSVLLSSSLPLLLPLLLLFSLSRA